MREKGRKKEKKRGEPLFIKKRSLEAQAGVQTPIRKPSVQLHKKDANQQTNDARKTEGGKRKRGRKERRGVIAAGREDMQASAVPRTIRQSKCRWGGGGRGVDTMQKACGQKKKKGNSQFAVSVIRLRKALERRRRTKFRPAIQESYQLKNQHKGEGRRWMAGRKNCKNSVFDRGRNQKNKPGITGEIPGGRGTSRPASQNGSPGTPTSKTAQPSPKLRSRVKNERDRDDPVGRGTKRQEGAKHPRALGDIGGGGAPIFGLEALAEKD